MSMVWSEKVQKSFPASRMRKGKEGERERGRRYRRRRQREEEGGEEEWKIG